MTPELVQVGTKLDDLVKLLGANLHTISAGEKLLTEEQVTMLLAATMNLSMVTRNIVTPFVMTQGVAANEKKIITLKD